MGALVSQQTVIAKVSAETRWWVSGRMKKLRSQLHETMSINPFLIPILFDLHHAQKFTELGELLVAVHLMIGHSTGFGKLIDEKLLPRLFDTNKLDAKFRAATPPLADHCFDGIDLLVPRPSGMPGLVSLKASRWTIQLAAAVGLNHAFHEILTKYPGQFEQIVVGVWYGTASGLTDKYDIVRGINRGKQHGVYGLQSQVQILTGRDFWSWMNGGEAATQDWVLDGILTGLREANCREECRGLLEGYIGAFNNRYASHCNPDGSVNWHQILAEING